MKKLTLLKESASIYKPPVSDIQQVYQQVDIDLVQNKVSSQNEEVLSIQLRVARGENVLIAK